MSAGWSLKSVSHIILRTVSGMESRFYSRVLCSWWFPQIKPEAVKAHVSKLISPDFYREFIRKNQFQKLPTNWNNKKYFPTTEYVSSEQEVLDEMDSWISVNYFHDSNSGTSFALLSSHGYPDECFGSRPCINRLWCVCAGPTVDRRLHRNRLRARQHHDLRRSPSSSHCLAVRAMETCLHSSYKIRVGCSSVLSC